MPARNAKSSRPRLLWWWRYDILRSDLPAPARLVLLTAAHHMTDAAESCFTSTKLLANETGLSAERVAEALRQAVEERIIEVHMFYRDEMCLTRVFKP